MANVKAYHLKPTGNIPNSPLPLIYYPGFFKVDKQLPGLVYDILMENGWHTQWIYRYGSTQPSHYHSSAHECMAVLSGQATIRFGVADISEEDQDGGVEIAATPGDVFIIPAGVAHKTFNTTPVAEFSLLTPGNGQNIESDQPRQTVASTKLNGFTMLGAYPIGSHWDFQTGDMEKQSSRSTIWGIPRPQKDPVLGTSAEGLCRLWQ